MRKERLTSFMCRVVIALALAILPVMIPGHAWAVNCADVIAGGPTGPLAGLDSDGDGLTDFQECTSITTPGNPPLVVTSCFATQQARNTCLDPNSKDLFVIYKPTPTGSLLVPASGTGGVPRPFDNATISGSNISVTFTGLSALGVTVHQITEAQAGTDRSVTLTQKAIKVTESLDTNGTITGNCQWGTPNGLDGCVVYSQRVLNFINSTCDSAGDRTFTNRDAVFRAYMTYIVLHETGHTLGGLAAAYDSRFGGYHYKTGTGVVMEQSAAYAAKGGKCTFYISSGWNPTLDIPRIGAQQ